MSYQQVTLVGRVGRDPELRFTQDGTPVCSFSMATSESWTSNGEKRTETTWWKVTVWRRMAEMVNQYLSKGREVLVVGRVSGDKVEGNNGETKVVPHTWLTEGGEPRAQFEITASSVKFLGGRGNGGGGGGSDEPPQQEEEDSIPF
jgi:single-strand DNA-binding protein